MIEWHPLFVHFPLALGISAAALLAAARLAPDPRHAAVLAVAGTCNLVLASLASLFALGSGLAAVLDLHVAGEAQRSVSLHAVWAVFTSVALALLAVWRGAGNAPDSRPSWLLVSLLLAAAGGLIVTGYRGGQNVYRHGIGVAPQSTAAPLTRPDAGPR